MSNQAPGVNEYEKSVFLTKAQEQLVRSYFDSQLNKSNKGFDFSPKRQYDFSSIIKTSTLSKPRNDTIGSFGYVKFDSRSAIYALPEDYFLSINEMIESGACRYSIVPIMYSEYQRLMSRPFQYPAKRKVWRLITDKKELYYNNVRYLDTKSNWSVTVFRSDMCKKPITFIVNQSTGSTSGQPRPPLVEEDKNHVVITTYPTIGSYVSYWLLFLMSTSPYPWKDSEGNDVNMLSYIKGFDKESLWPSFDMPSNTSGLYGATQDFTDINNPYLVPYSSTGTKVEMEIPYSYNTLVECIGDYPEDSVYKIRYVRTLNPIILCDLREFGVTINGISEKSECELPKETHEEILQRAVELAKAAYTGDLSSQIALGVSSNTDIGMIAKS